MSLLNHMAIVKASMCCATLTGLHLPETRDRIFLGSSEVLAKCSVPPQAPEGDLCPTAHPGGLLRVGAVVAT